MKKLLILSFLIISCDNPENHGNLSIFETPSSEQFDKWLEIDSVYIDMVTPMVKVYKGSAKLNFNGNPWENKSFQSEYSDLTWRELYDYVIYSKEIYNELGYQEGGKFLDSLNNRFDQMRDDLITWKDSKD
ncbi:hypothetical protein N9F78_00510 [Flavobacteriaceae bacterium]|jgi:hypothetical protein|nr:hypothetical protein [Flavobacteriaceae bacterium]MDA7636670.1 hypothetical protein [Flavobacteriaceae bacterium]MDA8934789.1 hypothetical protein [Flavobacteriaceae bacterium]MDA9084401.1 hypothetical protein [Flavobacteriaceae bacterium]MDA9818334.1 hypothetical protein [Flavobacteriaceae bacterium]|tara:strand:+ start:351 stop:743 length:393 start_codon:yes stop_codon:yes gene_type:complete